MHEKIIFKEKFIERYSGLTGFDEFKKVSLTFLRRSIRANTLKISVNSLKKRLEEKWNLDPIPWCSEGFWIEHHKKERRDIGNIPEHTLGYFYTQEAASMIPPIVLDPKPGEFVLDMCASPGSKTTQIAAMMENQGIVIANDIKGARISPLGINLQRMGMTNHLITMMEGRYFKGFNFDRILVDAPCSGTGTIRKSFKTLLMWNPDMIKRLASQQKVLIETAFNNLKDDGVLVYSTCSLEPEEDEGVIDFLVTKYGNAKIEKFELNLKRSNPVLEFEGKVYDKRIKDCLRIWPQDNDTEGFFVAKIRKIESGKQISRNEA
ncbi:RsmB/NOP family class I SAM-dependent RNA methyltransferase [Candidatus Woesearchaeota archaeon]|nr:RsmB/NOP family class I SAM-dependent RNA methyltransferase [Candidatus Woesearchaeota archaeon]